MRRVLCALVPLMLLSALPATASAALPDCSAPGPETLAACERNDGECRSTDVGAGLALQGLRCDFGGTTIECLTFGLLVSWCGSSRSASGEIYVASVASWDENGCHQAVDPTIKCRIPGPPHPSVLGLSDRWGRLLP